MREPCRMGCGRWGGGAGRWEAAGAGRGFFVGRVSTAAPGDTGGTHPGRSSWVWNVVIPTGSGHVTCSGKPTARKAQLPGGQRMTREANAGGRKAAGNRGNDDRPSAGRPG